VPRLHLHLARAAAQGVAAAVLAVATVLPATADADLVLAAAHGAFDGDLHAVGEQVPARLHHVIWGRRSPTSLSYQYWGHPYVFYPYRFLT
jgi:hypothetical protein